MNQSSFHDPERRGQKQEVCGLSRGGCLLGVKGGKEGGGRGAEEVQKTCRRGPYCKGQNNGQNDGTMDRQM